MLSSLSLSSSAKRVLPGVLAVNKERKELILKCSGKNK